VPRRPRAERTPAALPITATSNIFSVAHRSRCLSPTCTPTKNRFRKQACSDYHSSFVLLPARCVDRFSPNSVLSICALVLPMRTPPALNAQQVDPFYRSPIRTIGSEVPSPKDRSASARPVDTPRSPIPVIPRLRRMKWRPPHRPLCGGGALISAGVPSQPNTHYFGAPSPAAFGKPPDECVSPGDNPR